jgi:molecular chaperone DnaK (HSP70)
MPYVLGIDIGNTWTCAAIRIRGDQQWREPQPVPLGAHSPAAASVLFLDDDGYLLTGDLAVQAGAAKPERLITGFHERIGDDVPMIVSGEPFSPQSLTAVLVGWIVDRVTSDQGGPAESVVLTHPADWGPYRCGLLLDALRDADLAQVTITPGPMAAPAAATKSPASKLLTGYRRRLAPAAVIIVAVTGMLLSFEGQVTTASAPPPSHGSAAPQTACNGRPRC